MFQDGNKTKSVQYIPVLTSFQHNCLLAMSSLFVHQWYEINLTWLEKDSKMQLCSSLNYLEVF